MMQINYMLVYLKARKVDVILMLQLRSNAHTPILLLMQMRRTILRNMRYKRLRAV